MEYWHPTRASVYCDFKAELREQVSGHVARGAPVSEDDVVVVKFVKLDPGELGPETALT
jgi:hypothetical protein